MGGIADDFNVCGGQSTTKKHVVNERAYRQGTMTMSKQDGVKGVAVEEEERAVRKITESTYA